MELEKVRTARHKGLTEAEDYFASRNRIFSKNRKTWQGRAKKPSNSKKYRPKQGDVEEADYDDKYWQKTDHGFRIELPCEKFFRCIYCGVRYTTWPQHKAHCEWLKNENFDRTIWYHCERCNVTEDIMTHLCPRPEDSTRNITITNSELENDYIPPAHLCFCGTDIHKGKRKLRDPNRDMCVGCTRKYRPRRKDLNFRKLKKKWRREYLTTGIMPWK